MKKTAPHIKFLVARILCLLYLLVAVVSITTEFIESYSFTNIEKQVTVDTFDYGKNTSENQIPLDQIEENSSFCNDQEDVTDYLFLENNSFIKNNIATFSTNLFFGYSLKNNFQHFSEILIPPPQV